MLRTRVRIGFLIAAVMLLFAGIRPAVAQNDYGGDMDYQEFYDELDPYGQWLNDPDYGYVWVPEAGDDFRPYYSNGHWAYTDYGNTWVSNYSWGWAPFHYGRWTYHNFYGWMWIPGNVWGPAWVSWRSGGGNFGWAPLGPGVSINIALGSYNCPSYWWNFAPQGRIFDRNWNRYSYGPRYNNTYINQTTIINNTYVVNRNTYLGGPRRDDLRQAIGREPRTLAVNNVRGPQRAQVRGDRLNIYRPAVTANNGRGGNMRPRDVRPVDRPIRGNTPSSAAGFGASPDSRPARLDRDPANNSGARPGFDRSNRGVIRNESQDRPGATPGDRRPSRFDRNPANDGAVSPIRDRGVDGSQPSPSQVRPGAERFDRGGSRFDRGSDRPAQVQPQADPRRFEQPQQPRFEQQQVQPQRSFEQPRPQRVFERPQQAPQQPRFERPQQTAPQQQRFERPQAVPQQPRFERPQQSAPQQPRFERPQAAPQPQPRFERVQPQSNPGVGQRPGAQPGGGRIGR